MMTARPAPPMPSVRAIVPALCCNNVRTIESPSPEPCGLLFAGIRARFPGHCRKLASDIGPSSKKTDITTEPPLALYLIALSIRLVRMSCRAGAGARQSGIQLGHKFQVDILGGGEGRHDADGLACTRDQVCHRVLEAFFGNGCLLRAARKYESASCAWSQQVSPATAENPLLIGPSGFCS